VVTIRYYGLYSNRHADALKEIRIQIQPTGKPEHIEGILAICKKCDIPMNICFDFNEMEGRAYLKTIGYIHSPPKHGEIIHAA
jgi:hypothetical protein